MSVPGGSGGRRNGARRHRERLLIGDALPAVAVDDCGASAGTCCRRRRAAQRRPPRRYVPHRRHERRQPRRRGDGGEEGAEAGVVGCEGGAVDGACWVEPAAAAEEPDASRAATPAVNQESLQCKTRFLNLPFEAILSGPDTLKAAW